MIGKYLTRIEILYHYDFCVKSDTKIFTYPTYVTPTESLTTHF